MQPTRPSQLENDAERQHLLETYRLVVRSVREAHSLQSVLEKERQLRRLIRFMRRARASFSS